MKILLLAFFLAACVRAGAQQDTISLPDLIQGAQQFAEQNLDTNVLAALQNVDQQRVQQLFRDLQRQFHGEYVINLASLKNTAEALAPLMEMHQETAPYAAWLKARLAYLQVADQFRLVIPAPKPEPGQPPRPAPNPSPETERKVWMKEVAARPWPPKARTYVPLLKPVFTQEKVPPQLVWVAEVESSFDSRALSPEGAAGLFQLMPDTAKRYGLSLWPRDQRYQPEPSARASAEYLKFLHAHFHDWRLALAAYNAGEGTVQKLLDRYRTRQYDAIARHLPAETQMYVPRVEAIILHREGMKLADLPAI